MLSFLTQKIKSSENSRMAVQLIMFLAFFYLTSLISYLLFHSLVEISTIIIAVNIFIITWNGRRYIDNNYFILIGIAFLFIGSLDLIHALAYQGLGILPGLDANPATQLWLAARFLTAVTFFISPLFIGKKIKSTLFFSLYGFSFVIIILSIFYWKIFPAAFTANRGLTEFKIYSEYIICLVFIGASFTLTNKRQYFDNRVFNLIIWLIISTVASELAFTNYLSVYGTASLIGHLLKVVSFYLIYKAFVEIGLTKPYNFLFRDLKQSQEALELSEAKFRSVLESANDAIILADEKGKIILWNKGAENIFGYRETEIIGQPLTILMPGYHRNNHNDAFSRFNKTGIGHIMNKTVEMTGLKKSGQEFPLELSLSNWEINQDKFFGAIIRDISKRKKIEQALSNNQRFVQRILDTTPNILYIHDLKESRNIYINRGVTRLLGYTPENIRGLGSSIIKSIYHPDDQNIINEHYEKMLSANEGEIMELEYRMKEATGKWHWLHSYDTVFLKDEAGTARQILGTAQDVSERKLVEEKLKTYALQLEHEKAEDEALLASIGDGILAVDVNGKILFTNKALEELLDIVGEKLNGKYFVDAIPLRNKRGEFIAVEERPISFALANKQKLSLDTIVNTAYYYKKDGSIITLSITATPVITENKPVGAIAIYRNITREKEIDNAKTEFVSLASHQLRTPLTSISLSAELLLRGIVGPVEDKQKAYLEEIYESTKRMTELIDALLNISRIELGTFIVKPEPTDIVNIIEQLLDELCLQINNKKLILHKKFDDNIPLIKFDRNILRIIAENLITNAIRYTPTGGELAISLKNYAAEILIEVKDTGCGIPENAKAKIFSKLFRAENAKELNSEGAGLGLYIVKSVAEKAGAKIWFESEENKGTTFYVAIPIK